VRDEQDRWPGPRELDDAELAARLSGALREELGREHVDVAGLLRATRQDTRRAKMRRRALVAVAAVAVLGIPVGIDAARSGLPSVPGLGTPAAGGGDPTDLPTPTPTARPGEEPVPSSEATDPSGVNTSPGVVWRVPKDKVNDPDWQAYDIPDSIAFRTADLPKGMESIGDFEPYRQAPTVAGQGCGRIPSNRWPLARREWSWSRGNTAAGERELTVQMVITGWNRSEDAFAGVVSNTGACRFSDTYLLNREESPDTTVWLSERTSPEGLAYGFAAQRLPGEVIVAVTVIHPDGTAEAGALASKLADVAAQRVVAAQVGFPSPDASGGS
jgi:hypothetical protein